MALIALTYVSYAEHAMNTEELNALLAESKNKNAEKNITGMLLYRDRYFIQVLEGEEDVVTDLYERIKEDPRHTNVLLVSKDKIEERSFGDWSMGYKNLDHLENPERLEGFTDFLTKPVEPNYFNDNPSRAKVLLGSFKRGTWW